MQPAQTSLACAIVPRSRPESTKNRWVWAPGTSERQAALFFQSTSRNFYPIFSLDLQHDINQFA